MTRLINLLSWLRGIRFWQLRAAGGASAGWPALAVRVEGQGLLVPASEWTTDSPPWAPARSMRSCSVTAWCSTVWTLVFAAAPWACPDQLEDLFALF